MPSVCVVGGGLSAGEAALECSKRGWDVTVFAPGRRSLPPDFANFPNDPRLEAQSDTLSSPRIETRQEVVTGITRSRSVITRSRSTRFERVVLASGSSSVPPPVPGLNKDRVFTLVDGMTYRSIRDSLNSDPAPAVFGATLQSLQVAERLLCAGYQPRLVWNPHSLRRVLGDIVADRLIDSMDASSLITCVGAVEMVVGKGKVEAIIASGRVIPCSSAIVLPGTLPFLPPVSLKTGSHRGAVVDGYMRTDLAGVFAAGGCAEFSIGKWSFPLDTPASEVASGRVAGANVCGAKVSAQFVKAQDFDFFGRRLVLAGMTRRESAMAGVETAVATAENSEGVCSLVFRPDDGEVLGVEAYLSGGAPASSEVAFMLSRRSTLSDFSLQWWPGSTDKSPLVEAASEGLKSSRRSSYATTLN